jgi:hypothetical protein
MGTDHDRRMLEKIPLEIQALIDSRIQSLPIVVIMARSCPLLPHPLPPEYAYTYLGLFRITNINVGLPIFVSACLHLCCIVRENCT